MNMVLLRLFCSIFLLLGIHANALFYDYSASVECLERPQKAQYNGGIIKNPEMNDGSKRWSSFGYAKVQHIELNGNKFIAAHSRPYPYSSVSQTVYLFKNNLYTFSAWIQVSEGSSVPITAVFKTKNGYEKAGSVVSHSNCWSMLKGGLTVDTSGPAQLYFQSPSSENTTAEIWVDSVSLQPFTPKQWKSHQDQSIAKNRKVKVKIQAVDKQGNPLRNARVSIVQKSASFPIGCAINKNILNNQAYQNWFTSRFRLTVFENEMKWYSTESSNGKVDYSVADSLLNFAKRHNIAVRGHNVLWDDPHYQPNWVYSLSPNDLHTKTISRIQSVMSKYRGQLIGWDVVNENMHFNYFESKFGARASAGFYNLAAKMDGSTRLFLNEFNTIEESGDRAVSPARYVQKLKEIRSYPGNGNLKMGIGLEGHFGVPNIPYIRSSIDALGTTNLPIWITEVDVKSGPKQAQYLEQVLRELHSHPKVAGIILWSAWSPGGCYRMCLTDNNFRNLPTGNVVDNLLRQFRGVENSVGSTDADGFFEASVPHGDYHLRVHHPSVNSSLHMSSSVDHLSGSKHFVFNFTV